MGHMYTSLEAGCERYRAITTGHFRRAVGALLVYDITKMDTFKSLSIWLSLVKEYAEKDIIIALVANKCDVMFREPNKREVNKENAIKFAKENNLLFSEESSAYSDINIKEVIENLLMSKQLM